MLDAGILKGLLSHDFYLNVKERLSPELFEDEIRDLYEVVAAAQDKYERDLTTEEVKAVWEIQNPVATPADKYNFEDLLDDVERAEAMSPDVAADVVDNLWKRHVGKTLASYALEVAEGNDDAMQKLRALLERSVEGFSPDDFGDDTSDDIVTLISEFGDEGRWKFNIETLARKVYGIGPGDFGIAFATPETGKTAFVVSLSIGPGGFIDQGARVGILGNEEKTERTMVRACMAATGMDKFKIAEDPEMARQIFRAKKQGRFFMKDAMDWDLNRVEAYIKARQLDIIFIDQLDKVKIPANFEKSYERFREIYRQTREIAKRQNCAIIGISQASNEATGKTRVTMDMMEGSKIGKAAEADLIIGIGKHPDSDDGSDPVRFLCISKNKLSGWHGTLPVILQPEVSRYVE